jgi:hypothetical protein
MNDDQVEDPHWDLVIEIAAKMWVEGRYVTRLNPLPTQHFVDLQWAARQAGRILGGRSTTKDTCSCTAPAGIGAASTTAARTCCLYAVVEAEAVVRTM